MEKGNSQTRNNPENISKRLINLIFLENASTTPTNQLPHKEIRENTFQFAGVGTWQTFHRYSENHT